MTRERHEIDELARALPPFRPDHTRAERVRTETLARVAEAAATPADRRRTRAALWIALPVAAAAGLVWFLLARDKASEDAAPVVADEIVAPAPAAPPRVRAVRPRPGAQFEKAVSGQTETVTLGDGSIEVEVGGLAAGESLRVTTRDAEIEAQGARFEVEARGERLVAVIVREGRVVMQASAERTKRVIAAGETWTAPPPTVDDAGTAPEDSAIERPQPRRQASRKEKRTSAAAPAMTAPPAPSAPGEADFQQGWAELRAGKARQAAESFAAARRAAGDGGHGEDAHFRQGIALARSGQRARATEALREFVRAHPRSSRAGEASAKLGWLLYEAGKLDEAERSFEAAAADRVPQVKKSAQGGLEAVERRRKAGGSR